MKQGFLVFAILALVNVFCSRLPGLNGQNVDRSADEQAIRAVADDYRDAYNKGDAKALASLWVKNGDFVDQTGFLMGGRDVIEQAFEAFFAKHQGAKIEIKIDGIAFLRDDIAIEMGTTTATTPDNNQPVQSHYSITHFKQNGQWRMLSVHENPPPRPSNYEHLKDLEWLIGNWVDDPKNLPEGEVTLHVKSYWTVNRNFIIREFTATVDEKTTNIGSQRIGWHAPSQQIRSWSFDSKGGIVTGTWNRSGDQWVISSTETLPDGQVVTATEVVTLDRDGNQNWDVTNRLVSGQSLPDSKFRLLKYK